MSIRPNIDRHVFRPSNVPFSSKSQTVLEVLSKFPNPLASSEAQKIEKVVDDMVYRGVWDNIDYFYGWFLADEANALTSWKGTKTATNVNSATFNEFGVLTDGVSSSIDTNIVPSTDLTNASLNNIHIEGYCYGNLSISGNSMLYGVLNGATGIYINQNGSTRLDCRVNSDTTTTGGATDTGLFLNKTRYGLHRDNPNDQSIYVDGVLLVNEADISTVLTNTNILVGARNLNGSANNHINARQSYFLVGGGFDLDDLNTSLNILQATFNLD